MTVVPCSFQSSYTTAVPSLLSLPFTTKDHDNCCPFPPSQVLSDEELKDQRSQLHVQRALQDVLYNGGDLSTARLSTLLNGALGVVAKTQGGVFVDFDSIPEDGVALDEALKYLLSDEARSLRALLAEEAENVADVLARQAMRKAFGVLSTNVPRPPLIGQFLPKFEQVPGPVLLPTASGQPVPALQTPQQVAAMG